LAVRLYSEVFSELGLNVSYESIRLWFHKAGLYEWPIRLLGMRRRKTIQRMPPNK